MMRQAAMWCAFGLLVGSCGDGNITELFVCYGIDPDLVAADTVVRLCVRDEEGEVVQGCGDSQLSVGRTGATATQAFIQSNAERIIIEIEADITRPGPRIVTFSQQASVPFVEGEIADVSLRLETPCAERICDDTTTCVGGACVPIELSSRCVTAHGEPPLPECDDPRLVSGCSAPAPEM